MRLLNASYFRFLSHAVRSNKAADCILYDLRQRDELITKHEALLNEMYEKIVDAAKEGKVRLEIPYSHSFWLHRDVHHIFREKGFQVHYDTNSIDWWWDSKENQLQ